jgi:hypothetical protein
MILPTTQKIVSERSRSHDQVQRARKLLRRENDLYGVRLESIDPDTWPENVAENLIAVWRSRDYLVQVFQDDAAVARLSINRTAIDERGAWLEGISWSTLQRLKREAGYGDFHAVEIFPADTDVVNVANMRHLWILSEPPAFAWRAPR